jgi:hypothetical protein
MFGRGRGIAGTIALLATGCLMAASSASATTLGSNLAASPNAEICPLEHGAVEASCTYAQLALADGHRAGGKLTRSPESVITRWRVYSGFPSPGTTSVKLRLHLIDPVGGFSSSAGVPYVEMPLAPGVHEFPAQLPIFGPMVLGLDVLVRGRGNEGSAPIGFAESGVGSALKWSPALPDTLSLPPATSQENLELLFNATVEPDRDHDGYGDKTQDRCPEDSRRQTHCDRRPPHTKLTYPPRQAFLAARKVVVRLRSSETGSVRATGQIEIGRHSVWGIYSDEKRLGKGEKRTLVLHVPAKARAAALRAMANGQRVTAKVFASATDRFGNESGATVATIKPKR